MVLQSATTLPRLVYYESTGSVDSAIMREKQIKAGSRKKKMELVDAMNPGWRDLYEKI
jgi:putative endonuclease